MLICKYTNGGDIKGSFNIDEENGVNFSLSRLEGGRSSIELVTKQNSLGKPLLKIWSQIKDINLEEEFSFEISDENNTVTHTESGKLEHLSYAASKREAESEVISFVFGA